MSKKEKQESPFYNEKFHAKMCELMGEPKKDYEMGAVVTEKLNYQTAKGKAMTQAIEEYLQKAKEQILNSEPEHDYIFVLDGVTYIKKRGKLAVRIDEVESE